MSKDEDNCVTRNFLGIDEVLLNGWMFCAAHGSELCHHCMCDHRPSNNIQIEHQLPPDAYEALIIYNIFDLDERDPIKVAGLWKHLRGNKAACTQHSAVGCSTCFDFNKRLIHKIVQAIQGKMPHLAHNSSNTSSASAAPAFPGQQQRHQRPKQQHQQHHQQQQHPAGPYGFPPHHASSTSRGGYQYHRPTPAPAGAGYSNNSSSSSNGFSTGQYGGTPYGCRPHQAPQNGAYGGFGAFASSASPNNYTNAQHSAATGAAAVHTGAPAAAASGYSYAPPASLGGYRSIPAAGYSFVPPPPQGGHGSAAATAAAVAAGAGYSSVPPPSRAPGRGGYGSTAPTLAAPGPYSYGSPPSIGGYGSTIAAPQQVYRTPQAALTAVGTSTAADKLQPRLHNDDRGSRTGGTGTVQTKPVENRSKPQHKQQQYKQQIAAASAVASVHDKPGSGSSGNLKGSSRADSADWQQRQRSNNTSQGSSTSSNGIELHTYKEREAAAAAAVAAVSRSSLSTGSSSLSQQAGAVKLGAECQQTVAVAGTSIDSLLTVKTHKVQATSSLQTPGESSSACVDTKPQDSLAAAEVGSTASGNESSNGAAAVDATNVQQQQAFKAVSGPLEKTGELLMQQIQSEESQQAKEEEYQRKHCWTCGSRRGPDVTLRKCGDCRRAKYCSVDCQAADYPDHRKQCKKWKKQLN